MTLFYAPPAGALAAMGVYLALLEAGLHDAVVVVASAIAFMIGMFGWLWSPLPNGNHPNEGWGWSN